MNLAEVRSKFPQYDDLPDDALVGALHKKYYSDIPEAEFHSQVGYQPAVAAPAPKKSAASAFVEAASTSKPGLPDVLKKKTSVVDGMDGQPSTATPAERQMVREAIQEQNLRRDNSNVLKPGAEVAGFGKNLYQRSKAAIAKANAGVLQAAADITGSDTLARGARASQDYAADAEGSVILKPGTVEGFAQDSIAQELPEAALNAAASVIQTAPALVAGAVNPALALPTLMGSVTAQEYAEGRHAGLSPTDAAVRAPLMGAFEVIGEKLGGTQRLATALNALGRGHGATELAAALLSSSAREIPSEMVTTIGQFGVDKLPNAGLHQDAGIDELGKQLKDTVLATVLQAGGMTLTAKGIQTAHAISHVHQLRGAGAVDQAGADSLVKEISRQAGPETMKELQGIERGIVEQRSNDAVQAITNDATTLDEAISLANESINTPLHSQYQAEAPEAVLEQLGAQDAGSIALAQMDPQIDQDGLDDTGGSLATGNALGSAGQPSIYAGNGTPGAEGILRAPEAAEQPQALGAIEPGQVQAKVDVGSGALVTSAGTPYKTELGAEVALKAKNLQGRYKVTPIADGFGLMPITQEESNAEQAAPAVLAGQDGQPGSGDGVGSAGAGVLAEPGRQSVPVSDPATQAGQSQQRDIPNGSTNGVANSAVVDRFKGDAIDDEWTSFADQSGTLKIPRAEMPQILAEHRGAMVNFLNARGIAHESDDIDASTLKPTQAEFSQAKVDKASKREGGTRSILVSEDGHVLDGHHQWMAAVEKGESVPVIRLKAPIQQLLQDVREFPSVEQSSGGVESQQQPDAGITASAPEATAQADMGNPISGVTPIIDRLVKRRAAAVQIGKRADFDTAMATAKKLAEGQVVKPSTFARLQRLFTGKDQQLADLMGELHALAKDPAKVQRSAKKAKITAMREAMQAAVDAGDQAAATKVLKDAQRDSDLTDAELESLDDMAASIEDQAEDLTDDEQAALDDALALAERMLGHDAVARIDAEVADRMQGMSTADIERELTRVLNEQGQTQAVRSEAGQESSRKEAPSTAAREPKQSDKSPGQAAGVRLRAQNAQRRKVDPGKDTMLVAIAKLGGIAMDSQYKADIMASLGIDKNLKIDIGGNWGSWLFTKKGLSMQHMAEILHEHGFLPSSEEGALESALFDGQGEQHSDRYVPDYAEEMAALESVTADDIEAADSWTLADEEAQEVARMLAMDIDMASLLESVAASDEVLSSISEEVQNNADRFEAELGEFYDQIDRSSSDERADQGSAGEAESGAADSSIQGSGRGGREQGATGASTEEQAQRPTPGQVDLLGQDTRNAQAISDAARQKDQARNAGDGDSSDFVLTGSDTAADQAAARGAQPLFSRTGQESTPAFKAWFGDSKVVDADSKPLMVFHGTPHNFEAFDSSKARENGFFFTEDSEHAEQYAGSGGQIMPVYLAIKKPMHVYGSQLPTKASRKIINGMIKDAKANGHDGIYIENFRDSIWGRSNTYIAFEPGQIKSAIGNRGTFEPASPDIRMSRAKQQGGMALPDAQAVIDSIRTKYPNVPDVQVVATAQEIPQVRQMIQNALDDARTGDMAALAKLSRLTVDDIEGAYADGKVYLVASGIKNEQRLREVFAHEAIGHMSIETMLNQLKPGVFRQYLNQVKALDKSGNAYVRELAKTVDKRQPGLDADMRAREIIALIAERGDHLKDMPNAVRSLWQRMLDGIKAFAKLVFNVNLSDKDVRDIVGMAERYARGEHVGSMISGDQILLSRLGDNAEVDNSRDALYSRAAEVGEKALQDHLAKNRQFREENATVWDKSKKWLRRQFTPGGLLPQGVFNQKIARDSEFQAVEFDVATLVAGLERAIKKDYAVTARKLDSKVKELLNDVLAGKDIQQDVPEQTRIALVGMRQYIDRLSTQYLEALQSEITTMVEVADQNGDQATLAELQSRVDLYNTISANLGQYVHRSYRAFDDANWARKIPDEVLNNARDYLISRNTSDTREEAERRAEVILNEIVKHGTAFESMDSFIKESKLGAKDISMLKQRKEIAPQIRALLGEYEDPRINFAKSATKMGRLIYNQAFLTNIRKQGMGVFLFTDETKPPEATVKLAAEGSEVMAPLNGIWVTPEIAQAFRDAVGKEKMEDWYRNIVRINGLVKYGKTVLSPTTAARNWMSAFFFSIANGHFNLGHMGKSIAGVKEYFTHTGEKEQLAYMRELKQLGVVYDTPYAGEMMRLLDDSGTADSLVNNDKLEPVKKSLDMATKFYQYGDDFWKIIGFENEKAMWLDAGLTEQQAKERAAERVRNTYPTYSMIGRGIQSLRRFPLVGTFVSFPAEIIRTQFNMLKYLHEDFQDESTRHMAVRRAVGMAITNSFTFGMMKLSMAYLGFDDDDDEATRLMAAPWQKNSMLLYTGRDDKGHVRFIDLSFLDPYNYFKRPIMAIAQGKGLDEALLGAAKELLEPFFGTDITAQAVFEVVANQKESGQKVYQPHDEVFNQTMDVAQHIRKNLQPGIMSNIERTWKAIDGDVTATGRQYSLRDEGMAWVGFRMSTLDPKVALYYRSFDFQDAKSEAEKKIRDVARDPNDVSESRMRSAYDTAMETRKVAYKEMHTLTVAAMRSGMTKTEVRKVFKNSGISERDAMNIINGQVPGWKPSRQSIRQQANKARSMLGPEQAQQVRQRYRELGSYSSQSTGE